MTFIPNEANAGIDGEQAELDSVDFDVILDGFRLRGVVSGCAVSSGPGALQTTVAAGSILYDGVTASVAGGALSHAAAGSNLRFDLVVADSSGALSVIDGTAFFSTTYGPSLPTYSDKVVLAVVAVPANASSLSSSNITDHRVLLGDQRVLKAAYVATGDILYASAASTPVRLAAGTNGHVLTLAGGVPTWAAASGGVTDHGALTGLTDDDHTQYALLAGRSGGQTLYGGTASGNDLTLLSTSHATKGDIFLGAQSDTTGFRYSEDGDRASIGGGNIQHTISGVTRNSKFEAHSEGGSDPMGFTVHRHSNNDPLSGMYTALRSRGSHAAQTIVQSGDHIGRFDAFGYDGTDYEPVGAIHFEVDGTPGNNDMPGRITFNVTPDGSNVMAEVMRIHNGGGVGMAQWLRVGDHDTAPVNTTAGDITGIGLAIGDFAIHTTTAYNARISGTLVDTASGSVVHMLVSPVLSPSGNSSSEFRSLYMQAVPTDANGRTFNIISAIAAENRLRNDGAVTESIGLWSQSCIIDSSSPATVGTITRATALEPRVFGRPSGTSVVAITTGIGLRFGAGRFISGAGATFTDLYNIKIEDQTTNTIGTFYGIDIAKLTRGTTNIEYRNAGKQVYTPTAHASITSANTTLSVTSRVMTITANANYTLVGAGGVGPTIADGQDGQLLTIINVDTTDTITFQDQGTLAASNLRLSAATVALAPRGSMTLIFLSAVGDWVQLAALAVL